VDDYFSLQEGILYVLTTVQIRTSYHVFYRMKAMATKPEKLQTKKPEKLQFFRHLLTQKMNELLDEAEKTVSDMTTGKENFPDPNDRATLESDRNFELRIRDRERKLLVKIQEAIKRIDDGVFGMCEVCGGPISEKRLMARPVTTLCIDCKTKQEKIERLKGE
jgi:DnaK suppressor protein